MSAGIIYIATGKKYIAEACESAASLKAQMPQASVTIFADQGIKASYFDKCINIANPKYDFVDKIRYMYESPYAQTIFIDTDTYICADISDLFLLLDRFDLAVAHEAQRGELPLEGIPESFPEMNTGVIAFRKSPQVEQFFFNWLDLYKEGLKIRTRYKLYNDQPSFQEALYKSNIRVATLTPEYNCRCLSATFISKEVKIIHLRCKNLPKVAKEINRNHLKRIFYDPDIGLLKISMAERWLIKLLKKSKRLLKKANYEW